MTDVLVDLSFHVPGGTDAPPQYLCLLNLWDHMRRPSGAREHFTVRPEGSIQCSAAQVQGVSGS